MIYSSWEIECDRLKLVIMGHFLSFISPPPQKTQKIKTLKKWKKFLEISSFYTCVPKMTIIWGVVPETRSKPDILFCNLGPFFALLPPHNKPENQNFEKMKKVSGDDIILHMCTKNHNHIMSASWDMEYNRNSFLSFWTILCPLFCPTIDPKIKIWKKCKNNQEILSF